MTVPLRAALYLRVSTARQAEHDISIPDQRRQGEAYCAALGHQLVETFVEPGSTATNDRRPEFQRMLAYCRAHRHKVGYVIVQDLSRFARNNQDQAEAIADLEQNGVLLRST